MQVKTSKFDWASFDESSYGNAGEVPAMLSQARSLLDEEETFDMVEIVHGSEYPGIFGIWMFPMMAPHLQRPQGNLARLLGNSWPLDSGRSSLLAWLVRAGSFPFQSEARNAAFQIVSHQLLKDYSDDDLADVFAEISNMDGFPFQELASQCVKEILAQRPHRTASFEYSNGEWQEELQSVTYPKLANIICIFLGRFLRKSVRPIISG